MKELLELSWNITSKQLLLFVVMYLITLGIATYFYYRAKSEIKFKDSYFVMAKELELENEFYLKNDVKRLKQLGDIESKNIQLEKDIVALKSRVEHRYQPREKGKFTVKKAVVEKLPSTGKYQCVSTPTMIGFSDPGPCFGFTFGRFYDRYTNGDSGKDALILIGNDRSRHVIEEQFVQNFKYITY